MKTFRFAMVLASFLVVVNGGIRVAANMFYPATVTFSDRVGDNITSDAATTGTHSYTNGGSAKLECGFYEVSSDLVLKQLAGPLPRYLAFSMTPITPSGAPTGTLQERNIFMNIHNILSMPVGTGKNALASFKTSVGELKLMPITKWIDPTTYATQVFVSRTGNVWTVTADPGTPPGPGDVAALTTTKGYKESLVGLYHTPFEITVTCPTCP